MLHRPLREVLCCALHELQYPFAFCISQFFESMVGFVNSIVLHPAPNVRVGSCGEQQLDDFFVTLRHRVMNRRIPDFGLIVCVYIGSSFEKNLYGIHLSGAHGLDEWGMADARKRIQI